MVAVNLLCLQTPHHQETELSLDNKPAAGRAGHTTGMLSGTLFHQGSVPL